ncbi:ATP-binding protein [Pyrodictium abyssi]|uniref:Helicase HerA central domain-containing protein n=1 Tax=Pyrodictium abyssi TaxID=54256 RepID=A0ABM8IY80_9CREN|nr:hypothetical protein PABY_20630 [Pyrodictium abyssi]
MVLARILRRLRSRSIVEVTGVSEQFIDHMDVFYKRLAAIGGRYVFECRSGTCLSFIELPSSDYQAIVAAPGLDVRNPSQQGKMNGYTLLPPPRGDRILWCGKTKPDSDERYGIILGYCANAAVVLDEDSLLRHILVVGSTGSGKSHTAARIAMCSSRIGFKPIILDWHGEYEQLLGRHYAGDYTVLSYPDLPRVAFTSSSIPLESSISVLERTLDLSPFQSSILAAFLVLATQQDAATAKGLLDVVVNHIERDEVKELMDTLKSGNTVHELIHVISTVFNKKRNDFTRAEQEIWLALLRRLNIIATSRYANIFAIRETKELLKTIHIDDYSPTIVRLDTILSLRIRKMYAVYLLQMLYTLANTNGTRILVVVEEAHNLLDNKVVSELIAETRKYGIGFLVVVHTPRILPELSEANFNTIIAHRITSVNDRLVIAKTLGLDDDSILSKLEEGDVLVRRHDMKTPLLVKVEHKAPCTP